MKVELPEHILNKIKERYELVKDFCKAVIVGGSRSAPYIYNPHDYDVIFLFDNEEDAFQSVKIFSQEHKKDKDWLLENHLAFINMSQSFFEWILSHRDYTYLTHYQEALFGNSDITRFNILEHKDEYRNVLKESIKFINKMYIEKEYINKSLYHILIGLYILDNDSYDLTKEQLDNANIIHDGKEEDKDKILELYNWIKYRLEEELK